MKTIFVYVHLFFSNLLGAIKSSEWMYIGASKLKNHINPENEPRQVNPKLKATLGAAKWVTSHTVKASGYLVSKAGAATVALGQFLAPHIKNHSSQILITRIQRSRHDQTTVSRDGTQTRL